MDEPDLDLIAMVQKARLQHDASATPSQVSAVYWIEAKRGTEGSAPTPRIGQWVMRTTVADVDRLWSVIKEATEAGSLGYKSKVSTASREKYGDDRLICVLTYDADDQQDVERVGAALRDLVDVPISYERVKG